MHDLKEMNRGIKSEMAMECNVVFTGYIYVSGQTI